MKRAIAHHRAKHAQKQTCETAAVPSSKPKAKSKATNVVDHWGGAHPPSALQCVGYRVVHVGTPKCNDIIHLKESKISKEHKGVVYNLHSRSLFFSRSTAAQLLSRSLSFFPGMSSDRKVNMFILEDLTGLENKCS